MAYWISNLISKRRQQLSNFQTEQRMSKQTIDMQENLYNLVERGQDAIDGILELSKETERKRHEVAGQLIKTVGETAEKLIDLQSKLKKLEGEEQKVGTQHNHLYVGSTSELQKFFEKKRMLKNEELLRFFKTAYCFTDSQRNRIRKLDI